MQKWTDTVIFVFVSGSGQPFAINAVNSFLLNMEKAYNKAHPEEAIPHLSAHILRHTSVPCLYPREPPLMIGWRFSMCKWYVNQIKYISMNS